MLKNIAMVPNSIAFCFLMYPSNYENLKFKRQFLTKFVVGVNICDKPFKGYNEGIRFLLHVSLAVQCIS